MMVVNKAVAHPWECDVIGHLTTRFFVAMFDGASYHFLFSVFGCHTGMYLRVVRLAGALEPGTFRSIAGGGIETPGT